MRVPLLLELGAVVVGLAVLARLAGRIGLPAVPLYLLAGLAFGEGGVLPLVTTEPFVETGAQLGLILLLFLLGLEYSAAELTATLRSSFRAGLLDLALNALPGLVAGYLLGRDLLTAMALGGIAYVTSSGIAAKLLQDLGRLGNRETPLVLSLLVVEDLAMAVYLPVLGALLAGGGSLVGLAWAPVAVLAVVGILALALRVEVGLSRAVFSRSDEALLLTLLGFALVVAGVAELTRASAAVGALLAGIVLSGPAAQGARALLAPLRDLFAALFFASIGLGIDPAAVGSAIGPALALAAVGAVTKLATGWVAGSWAGLGPRARLRAGAALVARGEFSIAIASLAAPASDRLVPVAVGYVLALAVLGSLAARFADPVGRALVARSTRAQR
ncbi:MAG TPA: cation:proton antiporter [Actinomycetota bacterium]|nr:cation:proton antiporter [Actinomycetota bacterium]